MFFNKVRNSYKIRNILKTSSRFFGEDYYSKVLVPLRNRKLFKVYGKDSQEFLQSLVTNDMHLFDNGADSMFTMFLNKRGRVLYDTMIYSCGDDNDKFLIECDKVVLGSLLKHLEIFNLKYNINFEDYNHILSVWALIPLHDYNFPQSVFDKDDIIRVFKDPRLPQLGFRVVTLNDVPATSIIDALPVNRNEVRLGDDDIYKYLRYRLGVGEGPHEIPPGHCLPLELNCHHLHGVSFFKDCYLGQELTNRLYDTGVITKRLMPFKFQRDVNDYIQLDTEIRDYDESCNLGKLKGYINNYGIGLIRVKEALEAKIIKVGKYNAEVLIPAWWLVDITEEEQNII